DPVERRVVEHVVVLDLDVARQADVDSRVAVVAGHVVLHDLDGTLAGAGGRINPDALVVAEHRVLGGDTAGAVVLEEQDAGGDGRRVAPARNGPVDVVAADRVLLDPGGRTIAHLDAVLGNARVRHRGDGVVGDRPDAAAAVDDDPGTVVAADRVVV